MVKKTTLLILIALLLGFGAFKVFSYVKYREDLKAANLAKQNEKAPERKITFPEGWTNQEIAAYLENSGVVNKSEFLSEANKFNASSYPLFESKPKNSSLEGFIFPDTYFIAKNIVASSNISQVIIKKALDNFSKKITSQMLSNSQKNGMTLYQVITLASIVEKETGKNANTLEKQAALNQERKTIAGIFLNRLNLNMPLQSDATVNFVSKKNVAAPELKDTEIDSPYNTYKYIGLPPGPICNPSLSSIVAVIYPTKTDYLYFLHDQKTSQVYYAETFEEHIKNKRNYLK